MAYMHVMGFCVNCHTFISFNPEFVPSITVNDRKQPLCRNCFIKWNHIHRISQGLEPEFLHPSAYEPEEIP